MLGPEAQAALRGSFRAYLEARLEAYRKFPDITAVREGFERANEISGRIWRQAVEAVRSKDALPAAALLLLPALNTMIDVATNRAMALRRCIYPRVGLIRVDDFDQVLVDLRESMNRDVRAR